MSTDYHAQAEMALVQAARLRASRFVKTADAIEPLARALAECAQQRDELARDNECLRAALEVKVDERETAGFITPKEPLIWWPQSLDDNRRAK
jgi:hypothetical protein